jgi:hypothetical protein
MSRKEEFFKAVEVIQKALADRIVTTGISSDYHPNHHTVISEIYISDTGGPKSFWHPEDTEGIQRYDIQEAYVVAVMENKERDLLDLRAAQKSYDEASKKSMDLTKCLKEAEAEAKRAYDALAELVSKS